MTYIVDYEGQRFRVASLEEAMRKWNVFREQTGAGASEHIS